MTEPTTTELTTEQLRTAATLAERVRDYEAQGSLATFAQARALATIRDERLYAGIQKADGGFYSSFGEYVNEATTKSPATISQNISVVSAFHGYPDEVLAEAGPEKLYIAFKMMGEGIFTKLDDALNAARTKSRADLMAIRSSGKTPKLSLVYLSPLRVTQAQADRFAATYEEKYRAAYAQVHGDSAVSDSQVADFFLDVVGGLPNDFLLMAASGEGGAAPEMEGGFTPSDVTPTDVIYHLAETLVESGEDPEQVIAQLQVGIQGYKDKYEVMKREREEREAEEAKAAKEAEREAGKWAGRLQRAADHSTINFADGAKAEVLATEADGGNGVQRIMLKGLEDGAEHVYSDTGEWYLISEVARHGIVEIKKPAPQPKEKKASAKSSKQTEPAEEPTIGISKAQQAGRKPRKSKKAEAELPETHEQEAVEA